MFERLISLYRQYAYIIRKRLGRGNKEQTTNDGSIERNDVSPFLSDGLLQANKYDRKKIRFTTIYNWLSGTATNLYDGELDKVVDSKTASEPADIIIGRVLWKIIATTLVLIPVVVAILLSSGLMPDVSIFVFILALLLGASSFSASIFMLWLVIATGSLSDRGDSIDAVLPESISFMYAQAQSDVSYLNVIRSMALAEDAYGPVSQEFQTIVRQCEYFGKDIQTAIEDQAKETPSDELSRLLRNMLSHIRNGSNITQFFEEEAEKARQQVETKQGAAMDVLSLVATLYSTASLIPIFVLAIAVGFSSFQDVPQIFMTIVTYVAVPFVSILFIYLIMRSHIDRSDLGTLTDYRDSGIASFKDVEEDVVVGSSQRTLSTSFGKDHKTADHGNRTAVGGLPHPAAEGILSTEMADRVEDSSTMFDRFSTTEILLRIKAILTNPVEFFIQRPQATLYITVPLTYILFEIWVILGVVPPVEIGMFTSDPEKSILYWVFAPIVHIFGPLSLFDYLKQQRGKKIENAFPDTLRRLVSANDSGLTLTESIKQVGQGASNRVDEEMAIVAMKAEYGIPIDRALAEFNNVYKRPQVARGTRLLIEAYRASTNVSGVLNETIESARTGIQIKNQQRSEKQSLIITIGVVSLCGAVILYIVDSFFIGLAMQGVSLTQLTDPTSTLGQQSADTGGVSAEYMRMVLFHGAVIHNAAAGIFMGYLSDDSFMSGIKYMLVLSGAVVGMWVFL